MENSGAKIGNILQIAESKSHGKDYCYIVHFRQTGISEPGLPYL